MLGLQEPAPHVSATTKGLATAMIVICSILVALELLAVFSMSSATATTWVANILHLVFLVLGIIAARYRHVTMLRVFAALLGIGIALSAIVVILFIIAVSAVAGYAGSHSNTNNADIYAVGGAIIIVLLVFYCIAIALDVALLVVAVKLINRINLATATVNPYELNQFSAVTPEAVPVAAPQMMPMVTVQPGGVYAQQPMGVVYTVNPTPYPMPTSTQ